MEYIVRLCPKCSRELSVPKNLANCICMYCGENIIFTEEADQLPQTGEEIVREYEVSLSKLELLLQNREQIAPLFTRGKYAESFMEYSKTGQSVLAPIDRFFSNSSENPEDIAQLVAGKLQALIDQEILGYKTNFAGPTKGRIIEEYQIFMTVYLVPMIRYLKLSISEPLADAVVSAWGNSYPKFQFHKGSFEELEGGFKSKLCFITSAVCKALQRTDDCYELTAFREFRDNYMSKTTKGLAQIEEYYRIAPVIVAYLNLCTDNVNRYRELWEMYLQPCLQEIENKRYEDCELRYTRMVTDLKKELPYEF